MRIDPSWSSRARGSLRRAQLAGDDAGCLTHSRMLQHEQRAAKTHRTPSSTSTRRRMRIPLRGATDPMLPWIWTDCVPIVAIQLCLWLAFALAAAVTLTATVGQYSPVAPEAPMSPSDRILISTWRCPRSPAAPSSSTRTPPAFLIYAVSTRSTQALSPLPVFGHLEGQSVGDIYVVTEATRRVAPSFLGAVGQRRCAAVQRTSAPNFPSVKLLSLDRRALADVLKLDLLNHLPHRVYNVSGAILEPPRRVVVLDSDAICLPGSPSLFHKQFQMLRSPRQFLVAARPGLRTAANASGIASGALAIDLAGFRAFDAERRKQSRVSWWQYVATTHAQPLALLPSKEGARSRAVWSMLADSFPEVWHELPCGLHAEGPLLQSLALKLANLSVTPRPTWSPFRHAADCPPVVSASSGLLRPAMAVAVIGGAGGQAKLAQLTAAALLATAQHGQVGGPMRAKTELQESLTLRVALLKDEDDAQAKVQRPNKTAAGNPFLSRKVPPAGVHELRQRNYAYLHPTSQ